MRWRSAAWRPASAAARRAATFLRLEDAKTGAGERGICILPRGSEPGQEILLKDRKYSKSATDRRIWLRTVPGTAGRIAFEVEDRGPGVPDAERRSIFQPFRRGSSSTDTGGAGLGLSLAKQWAELFGGTLSYRTADGGTGACFRLELAVG